jgi:cysteine-rich repeat protein
MPTDLTLYGDTTGATDDYGSYCVETGSGPELVYQFDVQAAGTLKFIVTKAPGTQLNPYIYLRDDGGSGGAGGGGAGCTDDASTLYCQKWGVNQQTIAFDAQAGTYYLFVDGQEQTEGEYILNASLHAAVCGDGVVNPGEECDLGPEQPNDGCDACAFATTPTFDVCPGEVIDIVNASTWYVFAGSTTPYGPDYQNEVNVPAGSCPAQNLTSSKDRVYGFKPSVDGTLTVNVGYDTTGSIDICAIYGVDDPGCWDRFLYAYAPGQCGNPASQIACSDNPDDPARPEEVTFAVLAGLTYSVVVDGYGDSVKDYGTYNIRIFLTPN